MYRHFKIKAERNERYGPSSGRSHQAGRKSEEL